MTTYFFFGCLISGYGLPLRVLGRMQDLKAALRINARVDRGRAAYLEAMADL